MMPQDFPSSWFEEAAGLAAVQTLEARTATAIDRVDKELRALAVLSDRVEALTRELYASAHHDPRPLLASARHHRRHHP